MNTKEMIEKLNNGSNVFNTDSIFGINILELIDLLKRGGKYEAMWEKLCDRNVDDSDEYVYSWTEELFELMVNIQQKYFPKEAK